MESLTSLLFGSTIDHWQNLILQDEFSSLDWCCSYYENWSRLKCGVILKRADTNNLLPSFGRCHRVRVDTASAMWRSRRSNSSDFCEYKPSLWHLIAVTIPAAFAYSALTATIRYSRSAWILRSPKQIEKGIFKDDAFFCYCVHLGMVQETRVS